jgi:hypothetical protein
MPTITIPEIRVPELRVPSTELSVELPKVDLPKVDMRKVDLPNVDLRKIDLKKIDLPAEIERRLPGRRRRPNPLPFVLAGIGLVAFVTWLVTMSPFAPRVRRTIDEARSRMGMGRDMDDAALDEIDDIEEALRPASFSVDPAGQTTTPPFRQESPAGSV